MVVRKITVSFCLALAFVAGCVGPAPAPRRAGSPPQGGRGPAVKPPALSAAIPVAVVKPTSSSPTAADRSYGEKVAERVAGWIRDTGIPVRLLTDDEVIGGRLSGLRVAVLPATLQPSGAQVRALRRFMDSGGKLLVCYASEPALAEAMGFRMGEFRSASAPGRWSAYRFEPGAPAGCPERIEQDSSVLRPVYPAGSGARVLAWWEDAQGRRQPEPAWVQSGRGFWMSHLLLEGDVQGKRQLLVALLGACDRDLWRVAAARAVEGAGRVGSHAGVDALLASVRRQAEREGKGTWAQAETERIRGLQRRLAGLYARGDHVDAWVGSRQLDAALTEAYAKVQSGRRGEFRGVWNHSGTGIYPGDWDRTCKVLAEAGMTALFPHVQRPWCAHYPTRLIPASRELALQGDQLGACLAAARKHGLEVHAWAILWNLEGAPSATIAELQRAGRLQVSDKGESLAWLCPSHPANREFELAALRELPERYPGIAGVQLDYIRYKSSDYCYCDGCKRRFAAATGLRVTRWPADARAGKAAEAYRQWRREQISSFVADARRELRRVAPSCKLSAAVYAWYPGCRETIAQDWGEWVRRGSVDFVCPMNYTTRPNQFTEWYQKQVATVGAAGGIYPGIGVTALESRLDAVGTIEQIAALRQSGGRGFVLFEGNRTLAGEILPYLEMGITEP